MSRRSRSMRRGPWLLGSVALVGGEIGCPAWEINGGFVGSSGCSRSLQTLMDWKLGVERFQQGKAVNRIRLSGTKCRIANVACRAAAPWKLVGCRIQRRAPFHGIAQRHPHANNEIANELKSIIYLPAQTGRSVTRYTAPQCSPGSQRHRDKNENST